MSPREHLRLLSQAPEQELVTPESIRAVYQEFYDRFGQAGFLDTDGRSSHEQIVDGRVVHFNDPTDRSIHLIVHEKYGSRTMTNLYRKDNRGNPYHHFSYEPDGFIVATTDGVSIQRWQIEQVHGTHTGRINGIDQQYRPENETLMFSLVDQDGSRRQLSVARVGNLGTMNFGNGLLGWLLDADTSQAERKRALQPVQTIGAVALAS